MRFFASSLLVPFLVALPLLSGVAGCSSYGCTDVLVSNAVTVTREIAVAHEPDGLVVVSCVDARCVDTTVVDGKFSAGGAVDGTSGEVTKSAAGKLRVVARVNIGEQRNDTAVHFRVTTPAGAALVDVDKTVTWTDDPCHPKPEVTSL